jgi:hypothetical protein
MQFWEGAAEREHAREGENKAQNAYFQHRVLHYGDVSHDDAVGKLSAFVNFAALSHDTLPHILSVVLVFVHHRGRDVPVGAAVLAAGKI